MIQYDRYGRINVLYSVLRVLLSNFDLALNIIPVLFDTLFAT